MTALKEFSDGEVVTAIYRSYYEQGTAEPPRPYLGASSIGAECNRQLWYNFRWAQQVKFDGRMYRLFQTGHLEEPRMVADLRAIGATVHDRDPLTGKQYNFTDLWGHFRGNADGKAFNIPGGGKQPHILEFKTHSNKSFTALSKQGVANAKPMHYAQMQMYMGWDKTDRALYLAKNKDTDELYAERIKYDPALFMRLQARAQQIIFASTPPSRITDDPAFFICQMCDHKKLCHGNKVAQLSCRTCVYATPTQDGDGSWHCSKYNVKPDYHQQRAGCASHLPIPDLLNYATPEDAGNDWILFSHKQTGKQFTVGVLTPVELHHLPNYSSEEIAAADGGVVTDGFVTDLKTAFPGAKIV